MKGNRKEAELGRESFRLCWGSEQVSNKLWNKDERSPILGRQGQTLVLTARTGLAESYLGTRWLQPGHAVYPEGTVARGCQPTGPLDTDPAATLLKAFPKLLFHADPPYRMWLENQMLAFPACLTIAMTM